MSTCSSPVQAGPAAQRQRGAALLAAMLTVALVATLAAAGLWRQWRSIEVEGAERARSQAAWVLTGALDWARLILREDARAGGGDNLSEPWAVPLQEARLSTFLAADRDASTEGTDAERAFLSGEIIDQQSRLNVTSLVEGGKVSEPFLLAFERLFELLGLPQGLATTMAQNYLAASLAAQATGAEAAGAAPLIPQTVDQLTWLGLPPEAIAVIRPHVTVLPERTTLNLNTASAEAVYAVVADISLADAQQLVARRAVSPLRSIAEAANVLRTEPQNVGSGLAGVASRWFEIRGRLRLDETIVEERSLVQRQGADVRTLMRERVALPVGATTSQPGAAGMR